MKSFKNCTIQEYLDQLSAREPVPGGGSAAALSSALGAGLIAMVIQYSIGKGKPQAIEARFKRILAKAQKIRLRLLDLVTEDSEAYLGVVASRKLDPQTKRKAALRAAKVPKEICVLSYQLVELTPFIVEHGNPYLMSDVEVALELLLAGYHSAIVMAKINQ